MQTFSRRHMLRLAGCTSGAALCHLAGSRLPVQAEAAPLRARRPNIIWIVLDTARKDRLSCYGHTRDTSPRIDEIAAEGVLFRTAVSSSPWTLPSHASMFTGMSAGAHKATCWRPFLDERYPTVAEVLGAAGYQTLCFSNNPYLYADYGIKRGFDACQPISKAEWEEHGDKGAFKTNEKVKGWFLGERDADRPFLLVLNYVEPHLPFSQLPEPHAAKYLPGQGKADIAAQLKKKNIESAWVYLAGKFTLNEEDCHLLHALYDAGIAYLDRRVGELLDFFRKQQILDDSLLIITSDHGEGLGEHALMEHQFSVYEPVLAVPLILRYPALGGEGQEIARPVQTLDLFPTIAQLLELRWEGESWLQGHDLFDGENSSPYAFSEYWPAIGTMERIRKLSPRLDMGRFNRVLKAVRTDRYKYIWSCCGQRELFDLAKDPRETQNLIAKKTDVARELDQVLQAYLTAQQAVGPGETPPDGGSQKVDAAVKEQLENLGYF